MCSAESANFVFLFFYAHRTPSIVSFFSVYMSWSHLGIATGTKLYIHERKCRSVLPFDRKSSMALIEESHIRFIIGTDEYDFRGLLMFPNEDHHGIDIPKVCEIGTSIPQADFEAIVRSCKDLVLCKLLFATPDGEFPYTMLLTNLTEHNEEVCMLSLTNFPHVEHCFLYPFDAMHWDWPNDDIRHTLLAGIDPRFLENDHDFVLCIFIRKAFGDYDDLVRAVEMSKVSRIWF